MRPITPVVNGVHAYAVAWHSKRDDGNPYEVRAKMADFGMTHENGYIVTVHIAINSPVFCWFRFYQNTNLYSKRVQDLFNDGKKVLESVYRPNDYLTVRVNPSGEHIGVKCLCFEYSKRFFIALFQVLSSTNSLPSAANWCQCRRLTRIPLISTNMNK